MHKVILLAIALIIGVAANCQKTVKKDSNGNYYAATEQTKDAPKNTGKTFTTAKGEIYPVYVSDKGKLFVIRISKNGNTYKQYLKVN